jgi:hypothetical protein
MKKWSSLLLIVVLLALPALACGFPLPAGTTMMSISKAVCADGETSDSCQARQDAYQLMGKLQSAVIPDLEMSMVVDQSNTKTNIQIKGSFEYALTDSTDGLGANIHAVITEGDMDNAGSPTPLSGLEFIVIGTTGYTSADGGKTWSSSELDSNTLLGLGLMLGLAGPAGTSLDLFADPGIFAVTTGEDTTDDGQPVQVQTLTVDLPKLLSNVPALTSMLEEGFALGENLEIPGLSQDALSGMTLEQFAGMAAMLAPYLEGTAASTTLHIGSKDGYVHYIQDNYALVLDLTSTDPNAGVISMTYDLSGHITRHNEPVEISAPANATEGESPFGGGLGSSLFGGSN